MMPGMSARRLLPHLVLFATYVLAALFGTAFARLEPANLTLVWLPSGIALSACIRLGSAALPTVFLASFAANLPGLLESGAAIGVPRLLLHDAAGAGLDALQPWIGYLFWRRLLPDGIASVDGFFRFVLYVCLLPAVATGPLLVANLAAGGLLAAPEALPTAAAVALADALGVLLVAPCFMAWAGERPFASSDRRAPAAGLAAVLAVAAGTVLVHHRLAFLLLPGLLYLALRAGLRGATTGFLLAFLLLVAGLSEGKALLGRDVPLGRRLDVVAFVLLAGVSVDLAAVQAGRWTRRSAALEREVESRDEDLQRAEDRYRQFLEMAQEGIWAVDADGATFFANRRMAALLGLPPGEIVGRPFASFLAGEGPDLPARAGISEAVLRHRSGRSVRVLVNAAPIGGGRRLGTIAFVVDTTRQARLADLMTSGAHLADLYEEIQRKVARDLHDGLGQRLAGVRLLARAIEEQARDGDRDLALLSREMLDLSAEAVVEMRAVLREIHPPEIDDTDVRVSLRALAERSSAALGVRCEVVPDAPSVEVADRAVRLHLFRLAQEGVTNAVKHEGAREIRLRLEDGRTTISLSVEAGGAAPAGAPPDAGAPEEGLGLRYMWERAAILGAALVRREGPSGERILTFVVPKAVLAEAARA